MTTDRLIRADAARNRERILENARSQITTHGPDISMVDIATAAGVAVGTLYRHFPTKTDLIAAVVTEQMERLVEVIDESLVRIESGQAQAGHELLRFIERVVEDAARDRALRAAALSLQEVADCSPMVSRAFSALGRLVAAGRASGCLRADLSSDDVALLACTGPFDHPAHDRQRWLELIQPGLLAQPAVTTPAQKG